MIDLHTHTLLSDGVLVPSELAARAKDAGYSGLAITDHVDSSNIESVIEKLLNFTSEFPNDNGLRILAGVELTHVQPARIGSLVKIARSLGAQIVVCHGESIVEPVAEGTNMAAVSAGVDILAHPGLVTEECARVAKENSVLFEITARSGHNYTNGHVAKIAEKTGVGLILNSDAHAPSDLLTPELAKKIVLGAGITNNKYEEMRENASRLLKKTFH
ncbi:MAG: histidinol phosphate phosphatase domain-containing protein [Deltaproteobacteria bacterium]|nr:histidinol phosphate phosphatase domain-containing protein [Deltaproteobacteria bacterium]